MDSASEPALVVDTAIAKHLEVLNLVPLGRVRIIEGVHQARALERCLHYAVHTLGLRQSRRLEDCWSDVNDMRKLAT